MGKTAKAQKTAAVLAARRDQLIACVDRFRADQRKRFISSKRVSEELFRDHVAVHHGGDPTKCLDGCSAGQAVIRIG